MGCGTGIVGLSMLHDYASERFIFIDVNPYALLNTSFNLQINSLSHRGVVIGNKARIKMIISGAVDIIVANPPYLPGRMSTDYIDASLIGGEQGYETIIDFIDFSKNSLKEGGILFLVYSSLSNPETVEENLRSNCFEIRRRWKRHFFFEDIIVVEASKKCT